jgi:cephalosporin hydroxylase
MGGSALYLAHQLDHSGGRVISIDIDNPERPKHPRITWLHANSADRETAELVRGQVSGKVMVILDSDHTTPHVCKELEYLAPLVTPGQYLVVEDTILNSVIPWVEPGPAEALAFWLENERDGWEVDREREKFLLTFNPGGYLRRRS